MNPSSVPASARRRAEDGPVANQVQALIQQVRAFMLAGILTADQGETLIADALAAVAAMG